MRSFSQIYVMAVFGVKYRLGLINPQWEHKLHAVIGQALKDIPGVMPIEIGGFNDHVHVLFSTTGRVSEEQIVGRIKQESTRWVNANHLVCGRFGWQDGSGRFSYSKSQIDAVRAYIRNQHEHHRRVSFREEYEKYLRALGVDINTFVLPEDPV